MGRSLQQIVKAGKLLGVGSTVARANSLRYKLFYITEVSAPKQLNGNTTIYGIAADRKEGEPAHTLVVAEQPASQLHSTLKTDWHLLVDSQLTPERAQLVEKSPEGGFRLQAAALEKVKKGEAPFGLIDLKAVEERLARVVAQRAVSQEKLAAAVAAKKEADEAAKASKKK